MSLQDSHQISEVKVLLKKGADGTGIVDIELTGSSGDVDTYTITLTNGDKYTFTVTNGSSIASIEKTGTSGNVDTYTITLTNGDTYTFTVTNATGSSADGITYDNTQSGASATNVQDALDEAFSDVETLNTSLGTKANKADLTDINLTGSTNTTGATIPSGYYFYLNGTLVRAKTDIASGATFTLNTNYEVVTAGALNEPIIYSETEHIIGKWIDGSTLYEKTFHYGTLPNATTVEKAHNISNVNLIVSIEGIAFNASGISITLPRANSTTSENLGCWANRSGVTIRTGIDYTDMDGYVTLRYTKTS